MLPETISVLRNNAIFAMIIQVISSVTGLLFFMIRRSYFYLIINLISLGVTYVGMNGAIYMKKYQILFHALLTTGVIGTFCVYSIIEAFFIHEDSDPNRMNESSIIILLAIPYFIDFASGCMSYKLSIELLDLDEERSKQ
jgi:hypothetical protein